MKASEIIAQLPEENTPERESKIIEFIELGYYLQPNMIDIQSISHDHTVVIKVMSDALMLGEEDDFLRINATMAGEQRIADILGMSLITPKIADLIWWSASLLVEPRTQTANAQMAYTSRMVKHSKAVTDAIMHICPVAMEAIATGAIGLVADVGKDWVLSNKLAGKPNLAANYGWHTKQKPNVAHPENGPYKCPAGGYMWQTLGTAHNVQHVDYSQVVRLMALDMTVDGQLMTFNSVATDPQLCGLVSYEGPLTITRHP